MTPPEMAAFAALPGPGELLESRYLAGPSELSDPGRRADAVSLVTPSRPVLG